MSGPVSAGMRARIGDEAAAAEAWLAAGDYTRPDAADRAAAERFHTNVVKAL